MGTGSISLARHTSSRVLQESTSMKPDRRTSIALLSILVLIFSASIACEGVRTRGKYYSPGVGLITGRVLGVDDGYLAAFL